tara:strand:- start:170 stop:1573 length:1404 start_codon:yes stop_codon:yes gene_type:complete
MALTKIDDRGLKTPIELLNNEEITLGNSGSKLKIYHDGSNNHSYIEQASSVNVLFIEANHPRFVSRTGHEMLISANLNGAVELYYNNSKKFETTSYGGIFGNETSSSVASPVRLSLGGTHHSSAGGDPKLSVWTNGSNHMGFGVSNNQLDLILTENDYDFVVYGGSSGTTERFRVYGDNSGIQIPDSSIARFGSNSDLQIYHDGTNNYIRSDNGEIHIQKSNTETIAKFIPDGAVELYYNNSKKLETSSGGVIIQGQLDVNGNATVDDNYKFVAGTNSDLQIYHDGTNNYIRSNNGSINIIKSNTDNIAKFILDGAVELYYDNSKKLETTADGIVVRKLYQQEASNSTAVVYSRQCFRDSIGANATRTITLSGVIYGNATISIGYSDGNFHFVTFKATMGGAMYSVSNGYTVTEQLNSRNGVSSITATKNNANYVVTIVAGTNQVYGTIVVEAHTYNDGGKPTVTLS